MKESSMMKRKSKIRTSMRIFAAIMAILMLFILVAPITSKAESTNTYGNTWVYDEANVVSEKTEKYIAELNEKIFINYEHKPQLAFIILNKLPSSMDEYKLDMFNEYGVGTKEENCGMLFVFAIEDREYGLEIGDGFAKGSLLRKDLETDFITSDMKTSLRNGDYDTVIYQVAQHLAEIMADVDNGTYAQKQAEYDAKLQEIKKNAERVTKIVGIVLISAVIFAIICVIGYDLIRFLARRYTIKKLIEQYDKNLNLFGDKKDEVSKRLYDKLIDSNVEHIKHDFLSKMHDFYIEMLSEKILKKCESKGNNNYPSLYSDYVSHCRICNSLEDFENLKVVDIETVIREVDEQEAKRAATRKQNSEIVDRFLNANVGRIKNENIKDACIETFDKFRSQSNDLVEESTLETHFVETYERLDFEYQVDQFCRENEDKIDRKDFNKSAFIKELSNSDEYRNRSRSSNMWMMHFLLLHMAMNRNNRIKREKEEQRRIEMRRKEEARRRANSYSSNNSTFGSGFGGGYSSGGGFKGGW